MSRFAVEELSDFGDYAGSQKLADCLSVCEDRERRAKVRLSPDGRHIHILPRQPQVGLMTFDKYERSQLALNQAKLDLKPQRTAPIVDVLYLDQCKNISSFKATLVAVVVYEDGKSEFWKFQECRGGWHLLQTSDLCNSPRARVVSVCGCPGFLTWCEERPPSDSTARNELGFCVCRRDCVVEEGAVRLGGVRVILHNNPEFTVISSGECVHLLPDLKAKPPLCASKVLLTWSPRKDSFTVSTTCRNTPVKTHAAKEADFKRLIADCSGYLSMLSPPEVCCFSPTGDGGLLLLHSGGWLCLLQRDGVLRAVHKLADDCLLKCDTQTSLCVHRNILLVMMGQNLHVIEPSCGRELQRIVLKRHCMLFANQSDGRTHLLGQSGLFTVAHKEADCGTKHQCLSADDLNPDALLVEAVFEEACKYYQQRSLSSTRLTVDALKRGGKFQAPISLASILRSYLSSSLKRSSPELLQNGGELVAGQDKLISSLEGELKALVSLEDLKGSLVRGGVHEVKAICGSLIEKEVMRLLSSAELDKDALLYLNSLFSTFPHQTWGAAKAALQLHRNGEGSLASAAYPDVWKTVLSPGPIQSPTASFTLTNGQPKLNHSLRSEFCRSRAPTTSTLPAFELLCRSVLCFQPSWLPRFLELAQQQQQGSAVLGLGLGSSSWGLSGSRRGESGENHVPLYKRALGLLSAVDPEQQQDLEVELLLVSGRPNAILQALRILMGKRRWERVTQIAQKFSKQSPLLNKEIFTTLLCEVVQHRDLDPYLDLLWTLCPEDFTVTNILDLVLKNVPSPSSECFTYPPSPSPAPFAEPRSSQLTVGLLKPLLRKVLQRENKPSQRYADILQSPLYPPPFVPRQPAEQPSSSGADAAHPAAAPEQQASTHADSQTC